MNPPSVGYAGFGRKSIGIGSEVIGLFIRRVGAIPAVGARGSIIARVVNPYHVVSGARNRAPGQCGLREFGP